jgi:hypothetical protein
VSLWSAQPATLAGYIIIILEDIKVKAAKPLMI